MTRDEAATIVKVVCAKYQGTLEDHNQIQEALAVLLEPEPVPDGPPR
jgi:hypothetical protein